MHEQMQADGGTGLSSLMKEGVLIVAFICLQGARMMVCSWVGNQTEAKQFKGEYSLSFLFRFDILR